MQHLSAPDATAARHSNRATRCIEERMDIEVYTARYEREHGHKPQGRRYWRFVLVSSSIAAGDHFLDLGEQMTYPHRGRGLRRSHGCGSPCGSSLSRETGV